MALDEGTGEGLGDQLVVELERIDLHVAELRGARDALGDRVLVDAPVGLARMRDLRCADDLGGRGVVARGRLGPHRAHARLDDLEPGHGGARGRRVRRRGAGPR